MNQRFLRLMIVLLGLSSLAIASPVKGADDAMDHTAPSYDMKAQALLDLERMQTKFVDPGQCAPRR